MTGESRGSSNAGNVSLVLNREAPQSHVQTLKKYIHIWIPSRPAELEFLEGGPHISMSFPDDSEILPSNGELQQVLKTSWEIIQRVQRRKKTESED